MASKAAQKRLAKEFVLMQREPPPFVYAAPDEKNILTWNFLIRGPPDSPFAGGEYHGLLLFPSEYPFKPPGIKMLTPSGRFQPDKKICFSMSDFHPGSWNPAWSVATILTGLLSFMLSDEMTTGSVTSSDAHKEAFAARSHAWNLTQNKFKEAFPEYCTPNMRNLPNMAEKEMGKKEVGKSAMPEPPASKSASSPQPLLHPVSGASPDFGNSAIARPNPTPPGLGGPSGKPDDPNGWTAGWQQIIWEKWRWGVLIALAVLVSRFSSGI